MVTSYKATERRGERGVLGSLQRSNADNASLPEAALIPPHISSERPLRRRARNTERRYKQQELQLAPSPISRRVYVTTAIRHQGCRKVAPVLSPLAVATPRLVRPRPPTPSTQSPPTSKHTRNLVSFTYPAQRNPHYSFLVDHSYSTAGKTGSWQEERPRR